MKTLLYIKSIFLLMFYQGPWEAPADGQTGIDAPIDDYLVMGLIVGILMIVLFMYLKKTKVSERISQ